MSDIYRRYIKKYMYSKIYILSERKSVLSYKQPPYQHMYKYYFFINKNQVHEFLLNKIESSVASFFETSEYNTSSITSFIRENNEIIYEILSNIYYKITPESSDYVDLSSIDLLDIFQDNYSEIYNRNIELYRNSKYLVDINNNISMKNIYDIIYLYTVIGIDRYDNLRNVNKDILFDIYSKNNIHDTYKKIIMKKIDNRCRVKIDNKNYILTEKIIYSNSHITLDYNHNIY